LIFPVYTHEQGSLVGPLPSVGDRVVTMDRTDVGLVVAVGERAFRFDGPFGLRLVLLDDVFTVDAGTVTLICNRSSLDDFAKPTGPMPGGGGEGRSRES
jgi:hypothetical protein